jgi:hypothetical protein
MARADTEVHRKKENNAQKDTARKQRTERYSKARERERDTERERENRATDIILCRGAPYWWETSHDIAGGHIYTS